MFPINFKKERAVYFTECLSKGEPIGKVQTVDEMLGLAGACFFALLTHGPVLRRTAAQMQNRVLEPSQLAEHTEADDELVLNDIHAAIEFVGHLTMLLHDEQYDETFEDFVQCLATQDNQRKTVIPIAGFKQTAPE